MIERLKKIIAYYNLSASNFADTIDVPRSSISHLLSGRNKPSLDFVIKVVDNFEEVELNWLVYGKGKFPKSDISESEKKEVITEEVPLSLFPENDNFKKTPPTHKLPQISMSNKLSAIDKKLTKVVLLYNDGSFEEYNK